MNEKKNDAGVRGVPPAGVGGEGPSSGSARARNRTVMLSPEITGELRGAIHSGELPSKAHDPMMDLLPPMGWEEDPNGHTGGEVPGGFGGGQAENPSGRLFRRQLDPQGARGATNVAPMGNVGARAGFIAASQLQTGQSDPAQGRRPTLSRPTTGVDAPIQEDRLYCSAGKDSKLVGFLVGLYEENLESVELRVGRYFVTSQPYGQTSFILVPHESVAPLHAIVRVTAAGAIQIMDQLAEQGTWLQRAEKSEEEEVVGATVTVAHGDQIRFGKRTFVICIIPHAKSVEAKEG